MPRKVLIAHSSRFHAEELAANLEPEIYQVCHANSLAEACEQLRQHPDLLLLDAQLALTTSAQELEKLQELLVLAGTFCLRLCSNGVDHSPIRRLTPFACGTVHPPYVADQIREYAETLLRVKQAENERNQAQEKLILYQLEVAEGLRSAAQIQHALLPSRLSDHPAFDFAWQFIPCETVGGDLFNVLPLSEDVFMAYMLDVSGHGIPSAMVTVSAHQSLSERTGQLVKQPLESPPYYRITPPGEVLTALDHEYPYERFEKFLTISYLLLEPATGRVRYSNGGHPPPILLRQNGQQERLTAGGTLIGMGGLLPYEDAEVTLTPGDQLLLYSDGITEHQAPSGEMFGDQRLVDFFCQQRQKPLESTSQLFIETLHKFGGEQPPLDDISLLCIQFKGS